METTSSLLETFGPPISVYTRAQGIDDGVLVDVTEWASADKGFIGGFRIPVALTASVWHDVNHIGKGCMQDVHGRAHDLLFMASLAARRGGNETLFSMLMQVGRTRKQVYKMVCGPNDDGSPCITIMQRNED